MPILRNNKVTGSTKEIEPEVMAEELPVGETTVKDMSAEKEVNSAANSDIDKDADIRKLLLQMNKKFDNVQNDLTVIRNDMQEMKTSLEKKLATALTQSSEALTTADEAKRKNAVLSIQVQNLKKELNETKDKQECLSRSYDQLKDRCLNLETYSRRENLIFKGLAQNDKEDCTKIVKNFLVNQLHVDHQTVADMIFQRCHRLRTKSNQNKKDAPPIICRFLSYQDRQLAWNARSKLKGTDYIINEDFPPEINERRQLLFPILREPKNKKILARLQGDKLIIDGTVYTMDNINELPNSLDPAKIATKTVNNITAFFTAASPLSNFAKTNFNIDGKDYFCVEQYYQTQKAMCLEKPEVAKKILSSRSQKECKMLGDGVQSTPDWIANSRHVMQKGCEAKFSQDEDAKSFLLNTGDTLLAEASYDKFWGTGVPLSHADVGDKKKWTGTNHLGEILTAIRDTLKNN